MSAGSGRLPGEAAGRNAGIGYRLAAGEQAVPVLPAGRTGPEGEQPVIFWR